MAAKLSGRATIFGFAGTASWTGVVSFNTGGYLNDSGEFSDDFKLDEVMDEFGDTVTLIGSNRKFKASINFTPVADSGTNTIADAALSLDAPAMLSAVTLASFKWASANTLKWVYVGNWKIAFKKDGVATYSLDILAHATNDLSTPQVTIT
jgi:hypothetical protein